MTTTIGPAAWVIDDTGFPKFGRHLDSTGYFAKRLASAWLGWSEAFQAR
jgi:SRSO17 transposase